MLYLVAGLFVALTAILWRLQTMAQKVQEAKWATNDARLAAMEGEIKRVGDGMDKLDDRMRRWEPVIAVIADRLQVGAPMGGSVGGWPGSPTAASAGVEAAASSEDGGESVASVPPGYVP